MAKRISQAVVFLLFTCFVTVLPLECYVCENQEDNNEKCTKTLKICEYNQDVCLTEIKWGTTPYWSQGALKQYYVSKRCSNKTECATIRQRNMPYCTHIWYQDWRCSDCCQGDRCNYYVINASGIIKPTTNSMLTVILLFMISFNFLL
ncbi:uncharacterized protein LOC121732135 [Aricia agestis]|uniref:uncharacterized protein LOC121732135 n=1 Tax=Aricia agestis TaxID=91739 RepID=UPI001C205BE4|nr:uncharacterized protein LOC121732135 [Aricia agestis]XP_041977882.1 uncharacterized protein LOC121732135 [Aricia agestis]